MPQLSLYLNEPTMKKLRSACKRTDRSLSSYVSSLIAHEGNADAWPTGYWDSVYGCLEDDSFVIPSDEPEALEAVPSFD